jgi:hypothetical protein
MADQPVKTLLLDFLFVALFIRNNVRRSQNRGTLFGKRSKKEGTRRNRVPYAVTGSQ